METTITIDDDIVAELTAEMQKRKGTTFKEVVNDTLRRGLGKQKESKSFRVKARSMGRQQNLNYDKISELIEQLDGANSR